jgi:hypothetical protein
MFSRNLTEKEIELNRDSDHFLACHMLYNRQSFLFCKSNSMEKMVAVPI